MERLHRNVLEARNENFRGRFKLGMQDAGHQGGVLQDVSASAFRALLRFLGELLVRYEV